MEKAIQFHQFIHLEKGPFNTAIINFLNGDIFQVPNELIVKLEVGKYEEISEFIDKLKQESLVIEVDKGTWIPTVDVNMDEVPDQEAMRAVRVLEVEEGCVLEKISVFFATLKINQINYYGANCPPSIIGNIPVNQKEKKFSNCQQIAEVESIFAKANDQEYRFNKTFNSCWGQKLAVGADGTVKPCIYSNINLGNINKENRETIMRNAAKYWKITKDSIPKCKDCELRYTCFDCREISKRNGGDLLSTPACKYDPFTGNWESN